MGSWPIGRTRAVAFNGDVSFVTSNTTHINCTELAMALRRSRQYVSAMKEAGYQMEFGTMTTLAHAEQWLRDHRDFRITGYLDRHRGKRGTVARGGQLPSSNGR